MASGKWQVASCKWQMASGKWQVASCKWQVASGKLQVANGKLQVASCKWQVASGKLQVASCKLQMASGKWQVANCGNYYNHRLWRYLNFPFSIVHSQFSVLHCYMPSFFRLYLKLAPNTVSSPLRIFFIALSTSSSVSVRSGARNDRAYARLFLPGPTCSPS